MINTQRSERIMKIEEVILSENEDEKLSYGSVNLVSLNEAVDEFFDVPDASEFTDYNHLESEWSAESVSELHPPVLT